MHSDVSARQIATRRSQQDLMCVCLGMTSSEVSSVHVSMHCEVSVHNAAARERQGFGGYFYILYFFVAFFP